MTTRSQKRRAIAELVSGEFETSGTENIPPGDLIAISSKVAGDEPENLDEIKTSLRKDILADITKILAENQKEMLKLIAPLSKIRPISVNVQDSDSQPEDVFVARTSTPVKTMTATSSKTTPVNSRNIPCFCFRVFIGSDTDIGSCLRPQWKTYGKFFLNVNVSRISWTKFSSEKNSIFRQKRFKKLLTEWI